MISFDLIKYGGIVDRILHAKAVYLQPGKPGDRFDPTFGIPGILIEVGGNFGGKWNAILNRALLRDFRGRGLSRKEALKAVKLTRVEWQELWKLRV